MGQDPEDQRPGIAWKTDLFWLNHKGWCYVRCLICISVLQNVKGDCLKSLVCQHVLGFVSITSSVGSQCCSWLPVSASGKEQPAEAGVIWCLQYTVIPLLVTIDWVSPEALRMLSANEPVRSSSRATMPKVWKNLGVCSKTRDLRSAPNLVLYWKSLNVFHTSTYEDAMDYC